MASLLNSPSLHRTYSLKYPFLFFYFSNFSSLLLLPFYFLVFLQAGVLKQHGGFPCFRRSVSFMVRAQTSTSLPLSQVISGRRELISLGVIAPWLPLLNQTAFAAETKKGFLLVTDKKDGYSFLYPFGWKEVFIEGQDKVFKDVIEPLENVSVNMVPTTKEDIKEFGPPQQVAETLVRKVLAPSNQKTKLINAKELDVDGKSYYTFEFVAQAPNYTRHALGSICIANGKLYALTTGANERRWGKMKDKLQTVVESFKIGNV